MSVQPRTPKAQVSSHSSQTSAEYLGDLLVLEAREIAQFDDLRGHCVALRQCLKRAIEIEQVQRIGSYRLAILVLPVEGHEINQCAALFGLALAKQIDRDAPDRATDHRHEMRSVLPRRALIE